MAGIRKTKSSARLSAKRKCGNNIRTHAKTTPVLETRSEHNPRGWNTTETWPSVAWKCKFGLLCAVIMQDEDRALLASRYSVIIFAGHRTWCLVVQERQYCLISFIQAAMLTMGWLPTRLARYLPAAFVVRVPGRTISSSVATTRIDRTIK